MLLGVTIQPTAIINQIWGRKISRVAYNIFILCVQLKEKELKMIVSYKH